MRLRDKVTVLNAVATRDSYNELVEDWDSAPNVVEPAQVSPVRGSDEVVVNQNTVTSRWYAVLLPSTVATFKSRLKWHGLTFEVDGDVQPFRDRRGRVRYCGAYLKRFG